MSVEDFNQIINVGYVINYFLKKIKKWRYHDHIAGECRGSAHSNCNINLNLPKKVPVIFHNLRGSNGHSCKNYARN